MVLVNAKTYTPRNKLFAKNEKAALENSSK